MKKETPLDRALYLACVGVIALAFLSCLPSLFVPIGFLAEGDALDYRLPIMKWILRHGSYPSWSWTFVDDFPMLGEFLMLPFFALKPEFARIVSIFAYMGTAAFAGGVAAEILPSRRLAQKHSFFLFAFACTLGFQPLLVPADHVMVDNIANCFALCSLWLLLRGKLRTSALVLGAALATRYMIWGAAPGALFAVLWLNKNNPAKWKQAALFTALASLGALPFLIRNAILNGDPFYPLLNGILYGQQLEGFAGWGRGRNLKSLLLFPYDLLYTHSFVHSLFDTKAPAGHFFEYKLGYLFYAQTAALLAVLTLRAGSFLSFARAACADRKTQAVVLFALTHFLFWWLGSPQIRFFGATLALLNVALLYPLFTRLPKGALVLLALLPIVAIASVRQEAWKIAAGKQESLSQSGYVMSARRCFERAGVQPGSLLGFTSRDVINGFFNYDFVYLPPGNLHHERPGASPAPVPDYIYSGLDFSDREGFSRWPEDKPCLLKRR